MAATSRSEPPSEEGSILTRTSASSIALAAELTACAVADEGIVSEASCLSACSGMGASSVGRRAKDVGLTAHGFGLKDQGLDFRGLGA